MERLTATADRWLDRYSTAVAFSRHFSLTGIRTVGLTGADPPVVPASGPPA